MNNLVEKLRSKLTCLIMQQRGGSGKFPIFLFKNWKKWWLNVTREETSYCIKVNKSLYKLCRVKPSFKLIKIIMRKYNELFNQKTQYWHNKLQGAS